MNCERMPSIINIYAAALLLGFNIGSKRVMPDLKSMAGLREETNMTNTEMLNAISAINHLEKAYQALKDQVKDPEMLREAAKYLISSIYEANPELKTPDKEKTDATTAEGSRPAGKTEAPAWTTPSAGPESREIHLGDSLFSFEGGQILEDARFGFDRNRIPVVMDAMDSISLFIEEEEPDQTASTMAQYVLLRLLSAVPSRLFRCADMEWNGRFFAFLYQFIAAFPEQSGGTVCTEGYTLNGFLDKVQSESVGNISALGASFRNAAEYNRAHRKQLPGSVNVIVLPSGEVKEELLNRLKLLLGDGERAGQCFVLIGGSRAASALAGLCKIHLAFTKKGMFAGGTGGGVAFEMNPGIALSDMMLEEVTRTLKAASRIDTAFGHYPELQMSFLAMDASESLRIPFAVDKDGVVQYFEIGGSAPTHALLSGSTGSGKSVAMHTLILQIVQNYHPDDVEIWAIDYKSVEFDGYIRNHSPHFRIIGHDTSVEFSLSLLDLLYEEYERRQKLFVEVNVKNIAEYRQKVGPRSMPRIVVFIDEFQIMTQAVQNYVGDKDYRTVLENLLKLTRAMGISLVLCSQTIASGLSGLTESARDQIGCRISLKHDNGSEVRETLALSGPDSEEIVQRARNLKRGQAIYREEKKSGGYEYRDVSILYINDEEREYIIGEAAKRIGDDFLPKKTLFVRGGGRIPITERPRHPLQLFLQGEYKPDADDHVEWYPASPTSLADFFRVNVEANEGANILMVGEADDLRESVVIHSICGFLMDPENVVIANFVDETYSDRARLIGHLRNIKSNRLTMNVGLDAVLGEIRSLNKIRPLRNGHKIYLWYGLDMLKNELFLREQEMEAEEGIPAGAKETEPDPDPMADLMSFLDEINGEEVSGHGQKSSPAPELLSVEECRRIISRLFEQGPENGCFNMVLFNNYKACRRSRIIDMDFFENRLGTKMSWDDASSLFHSSSIVKELDDNLIAYDAGSGHPILLRPYLMPDGNWYDAFNESLE